MLYEQEISSNINLNEIIRKLSHQKNEISLDNNIIINYFGDRKNLKRIFNSNKAKDSLKNSLLFINYKEIYIGGVSLLNINIREKFGLNKYSLDTFYLGQWKNNTKNGIGFLKISKDISYMGNFFKNQINGYGMLFYKENSILYIGNFSEGKFIEGICYNKINDTFYKGKIINGIKNDDFCSYTEFNKGRIFIGKSLNDIFIRGYLGICQQSKSKENDTNNDCNILELNKIIYFDKSKKENMQIIPYTLFKEEFYYKIQDYIGNLIQTNYNLKAHCENLINYFQCFDSYVNDRDYIDYLIKYNQVDDDESLENYFLRDFHSFSERLNNNYEQNEFNLNYILDSIKSPDIINS